MTPLVLQCRLLLHKFMLLQDVSAQLEVYEQPEEAQELGVVVLSWVSSHFFILKFQNFPDSDFQILESCGSLVCGCDRKGIWPKNN